MLFLIPGFLTITCAGMGAPMTYQATVVITMNVNRPIPAGRVWDVTLPSAKNLVGQSTKLSIPFGKLEVFYRC